MNKLYTFIIIALSSFYSLGQGVEWFEHTDSDGEKDRAQAVCFDDEGNAYVGMEWIDEIDPYPGVNYTSNSWGELAIIKLDPDGNLIYDIKITNEVAVMDITHIEYDSYRDLMAVTAIVPNSDHFYFGDTLILFGELGGYRWLYFLIS